MSLTDNTTNLNEVLTKVRALPEVGSGGSGGGVSVDTCTVNIVLEVGTLRAYAVSRLENGVISVENAGSLALNTSATLTNVVCGSLMYVNVTDYGMVSASGGMEYLTNGENSRIYKVNVTPDGTGTLKARM